MRVEAVIGRRRTALAGAVILVALLGPRALAQVDVAEAHRRADRALQSFLLKFWNADAEWFRREYPGSGSTGYWTYMQGLDAVLDGIERTDGARYRGLLDTFFDAVARRGWRNDWYDDMNWAALALVRAYDITGERKHLDAALDLFGQIRGGWDETCCGENPGGIWWNRGRSQKATASNAGPVITGVRLYRRTGDEGLLAFAQQVYDYWYEFMVDHSTNQVIDHINPDGERVAWRFTYNEGLMVGAATELFLETGDVAYRNHALAIGNFMTSREVRSTAFGDVLHDGSNLNCTGDCHAFKGIAYRYLHFFYGVLASPRFRAVLDASAESIWELARNDSEDLFSVDWGGPVQAQFSEPQTVAAVMALNLHAMLTGPYPGDDLVPGRYEAEDATLRGVSLEARWPGYSGWGYAGRWSTAGDGVAFRIETSSAGLHTLTLRYAAGAGQATRSIGVDGAAIDDRLVFPATPSWEERATVTVEVELTAGEHLVEVIQAPTNGNLLELDYLAVEAVGTPFRRGDSNADGSFDVSDPLATLNFLFRDAPAPPCRQSADIDGNGVLEISDGAAALNYLFRDGAPPVEPFALCGLDASPGTLDCLAFAPCGGGSPENDP